MKETKLNEREVRTVLAVFDELQKKPYSAAVMQKNNQGRNKGSY